MSDIGYTKLFSGNFIIVQRIKTELEHIGIISILKDESESGRLAGFGASIQGHQQLFVSNDELSKAEEVVNRIKAELEV